MKFSSASEWTYWTTHFRVTTLAYWPMVRLVRKKHIGSNQAALYNTYQLQNFFVIILGSGKSFTMMGGGESKGIIPRLCESLISGYISVDTWQSWLHFVVFQVTNCLNESPTRRPTASYIRWRLVTWRSTTRRCETCWIPMGECIKNLI